MIGIIDYGMGNLGSIFNMLNKIGVRAVISSNPLEIQKAEKLILPGVGAFDNAVKNLTELKIIPILNKKVLEEKTPILGICLGMQIFTRKSEEGHLPGLGWVDAETVKFNFEGMFRKLKLPHMGWNTVEIKNTESIFKDIDENARFYFVHSYYVKCSNEEDILSTTDYGIKFVSSIKKDNIFG
ncbi:MAG: imidazole glycerol phosphate synthase subunit HisH, partial [Anoxybacillus ayderensis]|nr:imidazole glycerol phosphate synthase subunit HisH [Anoxybacillus ayderensis]